MATKQELRQRPGQQIYIRKDGSIACDTINNEPSMTQQQYADECDINHLMNRYMRTGELPVHKKTGYFVDVSETPESYHAAMQTVLDAQTAFDLLPAQTRSKFENDPSQLLGFLQDSKNKDEAIKLGLIPNPQPTFKEQMLEIQQTLNQKPTTNSNDESKPK